MYGRLRLHDYRCFRREAPAELHLSKGFTALLGVNNAGKSALLRALYELRPPIRLLLELASDPRSTLTTGRSFECSPPITDPTEIFNDRADPQCQVDLLVNAAEAEAEPFVQRASIAFDADSSRIRYSLFGSDNFQLEALGSNEPGGERRLVGVGADPKYLLLADGTRYNVAPLLRFVENISRSQFFGPFRNAINEGAGVHYDLSVGTAFINEWQVWKNGGDRRRNRAIQRVTEDIRRLIGARNLEINASTELKTLHVVIDGRPHKLLELGAGISQLIVVLGSALIRKPTFIAIDEPETHLHPALQAEFLTTLASYAEHGVLFSTHSIGLARSND